MKNIANLSIGVVFALFGGVSYAGEVDKSAVEFFDQVDAIKLVQPLYPAPALRRGVVGHVVLEYAVDSNGKATNIEVVESRPQGVFDRSAIKALKRSKFEITNVDGNKVEVQGQTQRYVYGIDKKSLAALAKRR